MIILRGKKVKSPVQGLLRGKLQARTCWFLDPLFSATVLLPTLMGTTCPLLVVHTVLFGGVVVVELNMMLFAP